jgi:pimeloyl-ACP methyl ester carboxylesterase
VTLAVAEAGVGGRPLLIVHGFTGAKEDFYDYFDVLAADGWHVVAPDLRGHGSSPAPESGYGFDDMAGDVLAVADAMGWDRFALLGHSMGGMIAQQVAIVAPDRVDALVLMGTTHGAVGVDRNLAMLACEVVRDGGMAALVKVQKELGSPTATATSERLRAERPEIEAYRDRSILACSPDMYVGAIGAMLDAPDRLDALSQLSIPTLVMVGIDDRLFLPGSRELGTLPSATYVEFDDAGHHLHVESPTKWYAALTGFLESAVPAS